MPNIIQTINVVIAGGLFSCYRCHEQLDLTNVMRFDAIQKKIYYHCNCGNTGWRSFDATITKVGIDINDVWYDQADANTIDVVGLSISRPAMLPAVVEMNANQINIDIDQTPVSTNHESSIENLNDDNDEIYAFDNDESTHIENDDSVNDPDSEA